MMEVTDDSDNTSPVLRKQVDLCATLAVTIDCRTNMLSEEPSTSVIPPTYSLISDALTLVLLILQLLSVTW